MKIAIRKVLLTSPRASQNPMRVFFHKLVATLRLTCCRLRRDSVVSQARKEASRRFESAVLPPGSRLSSCRPGLCSGGRSSTAGRPFRISGVYHRGNTFCSGNFRIPRVYHLEKAFCLGIFYCASEKRAYGLSPF